LHLDPFASSPSIQENKIGVIVEGWSSSFVKQHALESDFFETRLMMLS
jgi:hypothetical protein